MDRTPSHAATRLFRPVFAASLSMLIVAASSFAPRAHAEPAAEAPASAARANDLVRRAFPVDPSGLTAEEIVREAMARSAALQKSALTASHAEANAARARLLLVPRFDFTASYTRLSEVDLPPISIGGGPPVANPFPQILDQYSAVASVRYPITEIFLTILPTYKGIQLSAEVMAAQRDAQAVSVAYQARLAFYGYLRARGAVVVREDSVRVLHANVDDLRALAGRGAATATDVALAEAALARAEVELATARGHVEVSLTQLSRLIGAEVTEQRALGESIVDARGSEPPKAGELLEQAYARRPELRALKTLRRIHEQERKAKQGAQLPALSASGNVYYSNPNQRIFPLEEEFNATWDLGLTITWSPNDLLRNHYGADDADVEAKKVDEDLRALEDGIAIEVASAIVDARLARERIEASALGAEASARYYEDQQALRSAGAATTNDVLEAEQRLRQAQLAWVDAHVQARMADAALLKARGTSVEEPKSPNGSNP